MTERAGAASAQPDRARGPSAMGRGVQDGITANAGTQRSYVGSIERVAIDNDNFRRVLFTGPHMQLVVMSLGPAQEIGNERHASLDQFFRVEQGAGEVVFNETEHHPLHDGDAVLVPAGTWHNVINTSSSLPLKLYTLYSPPNHPPGALHRTKADADAAEAPAARDESG